MEWVINQPVKLAFSTASTGQTSFPDLTLLKDGVVSVVSTSVTEIGNKLYVVTFTPTSSGIYTLFVDAKVQATVSVVSKTSQLLLTEILDEALGSWSWNKNTNVLTLYKQTGAVLATYNVVDSTTVASRERVS